MSVLKRLHGTGPSGAWVDGDYFKMTEHFIPLRDDLDLLMAGSIGRRDQYIGGSEIIGIAAEATGDVSLIDWVPFQTDNLTDQLSGFTDAHGSTLLARARFFVRVSNAAINVTPKLFYSTSASAVAAGGTAATLSGAAACSATTSDYSGTNQIQEVTVTLPTGLKFWRAALTIAGTPAAGYQVWARAYFDLFVSL